MNLHFDIEEFTGRKITGRSESLLKGDLGRYSNQLKSEVEGKSVLVIGGAGTIGASFVKAILKYLPVKVVVVDINENGLTELVRDCRSRHDITMPVDFRTYPVNFSDAVFKKLFLHEGRFSIVANFAAHKHVRSEKDMFSIEAMIKNNVIEAKNLLDLLLQYPPDHFFCVSTDKAANPVNIMGASKKLMEEVILCYSSLFKITTARFANVAFSNGSLLAGFIERVMKKQPLSSPSDVKRYFISPAESGQLCLLACLIGQSGEVIFPVLNAEEDLITFAGIASLFLNEIGLEADICSSEQEAKEKAMNLQYGVTKKYPVYLFASDTSGEKFFEEFYTNEEVLDFNSFMNLGVVKNATRKNKNEVDQLILELTGLFERNATKEELVRVLAAAIPTFNHIEKAMNLDQKM